MKTEAIKSEILDSYRQLSKLAQVKQEKEHYLPIWGINYDRDRVSGFVNQVGVIERKRASVRIEEGNEIKLLKKNPFLSWNRVLKNINIMLQDIIKNIDNAEVVKKNIVNLLCFSEEQVEKITKAAKR